VNASVSFMGGLGMCLVGTIFGSCRQGLLCNSTVTSEVPSPNGAFIAATVIESCGGAAGSINTLVEVRSKEGFWARWNWGVLDLGCVGAPRLQWRHNHLAIGLTRALAECVVRKEYEWNGIPISYDDLGGEPTPALPSFGHW